ncbi:hypothetical protein SAMN05421846_10387 [Chryseobacterium taeanense]|uniref:Uncharacterized protein n=1 Tax=Chryseobacterium taeanense TaxID=311334 RepID=A0A1G8GSD3_9FLAO|nr:hypothetical protein [Chryseobacterium taeanense]SDH97247.1 hypothetical protein SAMN05421846_10387 [Chryseobacterium taeanense]
MKKFLPILLLAFVGLFIFSCKDDDTDYDTYSQSKDVVGSFTSSNSYAFTQGIAIQGTDVVLVYRYLGDSWQLIPKMMYLPDATGMPTNREFQYNFVFDTNNVQISIDDQNFNLSTGLTSAEATQYLNNQRFRIVLVPASAGKTVNSVDTSDYNAVIKYYNIDESRIKTYKVN